MINQADLSRIADFEENFLRTLAEATILRGQLDPHEKTYNEMIARAANGESISDDEWAAIETAIGSIARKVARCLEVLKHQQAEAEKINADIAARVAADAARTFAFQSPAWGNA